MSSISSKVRLSTFVRARIGIGEDPWNHDAGNWARMNIWNAALGEDPASTLWVEQPRREHIHNIACVVVPRGLVTLSWSKLQSQSGYSAGISTPLLASDETSIRQPYEAHRKALFSLYEIDILAFNLRDCRQEVRSCPILKDRLTARSYGLNSIYRAGTLRMGITKETMTAYDSDTKIDLLLLGSPSPHYRSTPVLLSLVVDKYYLRVKRNNIQPIAPAAGTEGLMLSFVIV
ncbi:hypothetical protein AB1N83_010613 [Pleurotus pulmonarius]